MNPRVSILAPVNELPAEGADAPVLSTGDGAPAAGDLLNAYATVMGPTSLTFSISADGGVSLGESPAAEEFVYLQVSDGGEEAAFEVDADAPATPLDIAGAVASVTDTFDAEDGVRKLVEALSQGLKGSVPQERGFPVPLVRFHLDAAAGDDGGGVAQLLGVWLADEDQLEALRSDGGSASLILEEAEMEGRGIRESITALAILGVVMGGTVSEAEAGLFSLFKSKPAVSQTAKQAANQSRQAPAKIDHRALGETSSSSTTVIIDVEDQRAYVIANGRVLLDTPVSTARSGKYTPRGEFKITQRVRTGKKSTIYGCDLPYWMRLDQSAIGLHVGDLPGYPASAGCIRLPSNIAPMIFDNTKSGTTVKVVNSFQPPTLVASR